MPYPVKYLAVILGPTASGKTETALAVAKHFGTEIISADSRQFYRDISIGTAKPAPEMLHQVKHHFIDMLDLQAEYNVSRFEKEANEVIAAIHQKNDVAVMTGGSGLYIDAVCLGIDDFPDTDPEIRKKVKSEYEAKGLDHIRGLLKELDPEYYSEADVDNPARVRRALEVCLQTGQKYSSLRRNLRKERPYTTVKIGLELPREELYERINRRVDRMVLDGLVEEAMRVYPLRRLNSLNTVGYKELFRHFDGKVPLAQAIDDIKTNTRRYAKRQITWFSRDDSIHWFPAGNTNEIIHFLKAEAGI